MSRTSLAGKIVAVAALAISVLTVHAEESSSGGSTAWDRVVMEGAFSRADVNDDGMLSKVEVARLPGTANRFEDLDSNQDGSLNLEEFAAGFAAPLGAPSTASISDALARDALAPPVDIAAAQPVEVGSIEGPGQDE